MAARAALVLPTLRGALAGGLIGLAIGTLAGQQQGEREQTPGLQRVIGLVAGGMLGAGVGVLTWAIIDISGAFARAKSRRDYARRAVGHVALNIFPRPGGLAGSLTATY